MGILTTGRWVRTGLLVLALGGGAWGASESEPPAGAVLSLRAQSLQSPLHPLARIDRLAQEQLTRWWRSLPAPRLDPLPLGAAVLVDGRGFALTCAHLVQQAGGLEARGAPGRWVRLRVVAVDPGSDVAVVRLRGDVREAAEGPAPHLTLAAARSGPAPGAEVTVVGRTLDGRVRVFGRRVSEVGGEYLVDREPVLGGLIVLDGPVPAGWDGGAVLDRDGMLVGLALGWSRPGEVLGYALAADAVERGAVRALERRRLGGWLGVRVVSVALEGETGARVEAVAEGSPAQAAGVVVGDVVRRWGDEPVPGALGLMLDALASRPGAEVRLEVLRGRRSVELEAVLAEWPRPDARQLARQRLGVTVQPLTPELAAALDVPGARGVAVVEVEPGGPADRLGLRSGDVIVALGDRPTPTLEALGEALEALAGARTAPLRIRRGPADAYGEVRLRPAVQGGSEWESEAAGRGAR